MLQREVSFGLYNRFNYMDENLVDRYQGSAQDMFVSLWLYDDYCHLYFKRTRTNAGYDGKLYFPERFILDVDGETPEKAQIKTKGLTIILDEAGVPSQPYFSGTGFHVEIPSSIFEWEPCYNLNLRMKKAFTDMGFYEFADISVTDNVRIIRLNNTLNTKSNLYKIPISLKELNSLDITEIQELAKTPRHNFTYPILESEHLFDLMEDIVPEYKPFSTKADVGNNPDPAYNPCIQEMFKGVGYGSRHQTALRLGAWMRWRYPEDIVYGVMEQWRTKVDSVEKPFKRKEMDKIIRDCYEGHNGSGYRYGCSDDLMTLHCKRECVLFKAKRRAITHQPTNMKEILINRLKNPVEALNIGRMYGADWPVEPGEFVMMKAPPKAMKTWWFINLANMFKRETYFLEMEMSALQMARRFACLQYKVKPESLDDSHVQMILDNWDKDFSWLTMEYSRPYITELPAMIEALPKRPEIIFVDHLRFLRTKATDPNEAVDEKTGALIKLAIDYDLIIIGIIEQSKAGMQQRGGFGTAKGSSGSEYNASKVLTLIPTRTPGGRISTMNIFTDGDREGGELNITLEPTQYGKLTTIFERFR